MFLFSFLKFLLALYNKVLFRKNCIILKMLPGAVENICKYKIIQMCIETFVNCLTNKLKICSYSQCYKFYKCEHINQHSSQHISQHISQH